ncbi:B-cadherin-like [Clupea harengus]|uniref:Cadherin-1 n=1 Tax=Clupea harengus TaxID=7950 RepID=A0A6P8EPI4_CLUHA|nr:B-cadherin-like [Clupea harengus]
MKDTCRLRFPEGHTPDQTRGTGNKPISTAHQTTPDQTRGTGNKPISTAHQTTPDQTRGTGNKPISTAHQTTPDQTRGTGNKPISTAKRLSGINQDIPSFPVLEFPAFRRGMIRRRREWVIPPISISENDRGSYPKSVVQIRSSLAREVPIRYRLVGPGADQPPQGLFTIHQTSGMLFVTKALDRENTQEYKVQYHHTLTAHAIVVGTEGDRPAEGPMDIIIRVLDQNDNHPVCTRDLFWGNVSEVAPIGQPVLQVTAEDSDDPKTENGVVRYRLLRQVPPQPNAEMFSIDGVSGLISVASVGLDSETHHGYRLVIEAADMEGRGLTTSCTATISITDSNDHAPKFSHTTYRGSIGENVAGGVVVTLPVTDLDKPLSPASATTYTIVRGNERGLFSISTGPGKMEGIITTAKGLDFEQKRQHTLLVAVENEVPFAVPLKTSTATVIVEVEDLNEEPKFEPEQKLVTAAEDLPVGTVIAEYKAKDPDVAREQTVRYKLLSDPAGWLEVSRDSGLVRLRNALDREHTLVIDRTYTALVIAYDNDLSPASGTGTLVIEVGDVNDNAPLVKETHLQFCSLDPVPVPLTILDADGPGNADPFTVQLAETSWVNWTIITNSTTGAVSVKPRGQLPSAEYPVVVHVYDAHMLAQESALLAEVCQCSGAVTICLHPLPRTNPSAATLSMAVLGVVLFLLVLLLLLIVLIKRRRREKQEVLLPEEEVRDTLFFYNEEGGGEDDQEYDLSQLHHGLASGPEVVCTAVAPPLVPPMPYRLRPDENEEIGSFINDNLQAADNDPTAPPFDCLMVFDYEGAESACGSLSTLQSSSSDRDQDSQHLQEWGSDRDQDYQHLQEWGPHFRRLADMYGGGEDDDDDGDDDDILPGRKEWV